MWEVPFFEKQNVYETVKVFPETYFCIALLSYGLLWRVFCLVLLYCNVCREHHAFIFSLQ